VAKTIYHNQDLKYLINCSDADGDTISYTDNTTLFNINSATGQIDDNPTLSEYAAYSILITCSDGTDTNSSKFTYWINDRSPAFSQALATQTVVATNSFSYDINATDPEGDAITYSDNTSLFNINSATGLIQDSPIAGDVGNYSILITISDTKLQTSSAFLYRVLAKPPSTVWHPMSLKGKFKMYTGKLRLFK
jgi:hypothetical protein